MIRINKLIIAVAMFAFSSAAISGYDENMTGKVTHVLTYTDGDHIFFRLDNQPDSHPQC